MALRGLFTIHFQLYINIFKFKRSEARDRRRREPLREHIRKRRKTETAMNEKTKKQMKYIFVT